MPRGAARTHTWTMYCPLVSAGHTSIHWVFFSVPGKWLESKIRVSFTWVCIREVLVGT